MKNKELEDIDVTDLQSLIDNKVMENKIIEYKQKLSIRQPSEKKELLADISSFSNSSGGDLIFGIRANSKTGEPLELLGLELENVDSTILQVENLLRDGISPRIWGLQTHSIQLPNSKTILIIRIPNSWTSPHRVDFKGHHKFYTRGTNGKYPMDVNELRIAFNLSQIIAKQIKDFRLDRINKIYSNESEIPLPNKAMMIFHIIPFSAFTLERNYDFQNMKKLTLNLRPMTEGGSYHSQYTLEGFICHSEHAYTQLFKNGTIEAVDSYPLEPYPGRKIIPSTYIEENILESYNSYKKVLEIKNISPPVALMVSLIKIKDYEFAGGDNPIYSKKIPHGKDILNLPPNIIQNFTNEPSHDLKPIFDSLWNAYGFSKSKNFDENGNWKKKS